MNDRRAVLPTRRACLAGLIAACSVTRGVAAGAPALWIGTYTREGGRGLVPLRAAKHQWRSGSGHAAIRNASFAVSGQRGIRYILDEQQAGMLGVYDAAFRPLATEATMGADPCHVALSPDGAALAVANYSGGSVAIWSLDRASGRPRGSARLIRHEGSGPNAKRQATPHAHWVGFDRDPRLLHAVDLGADAIFAHRLTDDAVDTSIAYRADAGSGPRHLARHPTLPIAYLVAELANTVTVLRVGADGTFAAQATVPTLPRGFSGDSFAAHIGLNAAGTRLYVSNRGHDSIATFALDAAGMPTPIGHVASGGHWPRHVRLLEGSGEMLVANQRSGEVARLPVGRDGIPRPATQVVKVPAAVFIGA